MMYNGYDESENKDKVAVFIDLCHDLMFLKT